MAVDIEIQEQLARVARRQRRVELWSVLALCWALSAAAAFGLLMLERKSGWSSSLVLPVIALVGASAAIVFIVRHRRKQPGLGAIASQIESRHPELAGRLMTALQQKPGADGQFNYLQQRLGQETLEYSRRNDWAALVPSGRVTLAQTAHWLAFGLFVVTLASLRGIGGHQLLSRIVAKGVTVTPGDVSLERGSSLVVLARFSGALPPQVELVFGVPTAPQRLPLIKSLGDPMFGGSVPEVVSNFSYHIEYRGERTRDFNVAVYEHPRLERADADVNFPAYTALPHKRIENTRRLSAVEGSQVDLAFEFNKPVASARLVARDKEHAALDLTVQPGQPKASLSRFALEISKTYDLQLVDPEGRTNKVPAEFVFEALKNRTPELRLTSPRGDLRPSPLEEISFEGTVYDDFGVSAFGLGYAVNGQSPKFIELGQGVAGNQKKTFKHLLRLEDLGVKTDELLSWFVWADDRGPDGQVRRTMGDLYFGEVRPFEEVFREGQGMEGQGSEMSGGDRTGKLTDLEKQIVNATWRLERDHNSKTRTGSTPGSKTDPQRKENSADDQSRNSATGLEPSAWAAIFSNHRLAVMGQADRAAAQPSTPNKTTPPRSSNKGQAPKYEDDANVVLESQQQALEQAKEALQGQRDPQTASLWQKAVTEMEQALSRLRQATNSPATLKDALAAEQAAYQALIRLQAHEYQVSRSRSRSQSGSSRNEQMQRQLEELDLTDSENRYEKQREAQRAQNPERREQLQIMSRLQELARRQQDLNERLKELQTALQAAKTEAERAEIRRQLKRLQEEEQQMLADVDEVRQRMDRPENQSRLAEERQQLDQTRQEVQKASEAASQGAASQALAAGSRAQSQLQQLRDEMRKKSSSQFGEDLRQMRSQARELARQQEDILKKIQAGSSSERKSLSGSDDQEETRAQLARQKQMMTNLLDRASQVSQQAEEAEPLLSRQLYDTVRKFTQDTAKDAKDAETELLNRGPMTRSLFDLLRNNTDSGAAKLEDITSEMLRLGYLPQAGRMGARAQSGIENLKKGVERAAESVLGDDAEDLRLAQHQLEELASQLQREISDNQGGGSQTNLASLGAGNGTNSQTMRASGGSADTNQPSQLQASNQASPGQAGPNGPSQGQSQDPSQGQSQAQSQGQSQAQGQGQGQTQGQKSEPGSENSPQGAQTAGAQAQGSGEQAGGNTPGSGQGDQPAPSAQANAAGGQSGRAQRASPGRENRNGTQRGGAAGGGDPVETASAPANGGGRNFNWDRLLDQNARAQNAPITGDDFSGWSDRLREVEELIDAQDLRDDVAKARERARLVRQEFKRDRKKPDWAVVQLQVMKPLTEVRDRIAEELARRESREALVPLDRDPVPNRYSDLVRRYYEELGKAK